MDRLKELMSEAGEDKIATVTDRVEVVGLTIASCLNRAAEFLDSSLHEIDYEILERGKRSFLNPKPYRILVSILPPSERFAELEEFSVKLGVGDRLLSGDLDRYVLPKNRDGSFLVRLYRSGVFLTVHPPLGDGSRVPVDQILQKLQHMAVSNFNASKVEKIARAASGESTKIAEFVPIPANDSTCRVEVSSDEMKATVRITPPKPGGRHLEPIDVVNALKAHGVVLGFLEKNIKNALLEDRYMQDILAAQGIPSKNGSDAKIDFKVNIERHVSMSEDVQGRVDMKSLNLIENVVVGQILAEKVPAQKGVLGRTLFNKLVDAKDGKDIELRAGKGTILSEDGTKIIAEINGQVVYAHDRLSVEPVYRVVGDVGPKTGNIQFLGSIVITGNILDNYEVKAAGNIEVQGAVQKAKVEAEGDIIVKQGITGKEQGLVESTSGSVMARFIQSAEIRSAGDVIAQEGILHSKISASGKVVCNGRKARIVGGNIRAMNEVRARQIGSDAYTATEITVGTDPRVLNQFEELTNTKKESKAQVDKLKKAITVLEARRRADPEGFTEEQRTMLSNSKEEMLTHEQTVMECDQKLKELEETMNEQAQTGRVHAERQIFPGVIVRIGSAALNISDTYSSTTFMYSNGYVKPGKLEPADGGGSTGGRKK